MNDRNTEHQLLAVFDWLRFPLIVGVVFIHNNSVGSLECMSNNYGGYLVELFSQGVGRLSVPMFFLISGYLFFYKVEKFDKPIYLSKLKRRTKSLLIPYLVWNFFILSAYLLLYALGLEKTKIDESFGFATALRAFVCPLAYQMWFVRDLFCVVLATPLIYSLIKRMRLLFIGAVSILWVIGVEIPVLGNYCLSMTSIFFFSLGSALSIMKYDVLSFAYRLKALAFMYPVLLFLDIVFNSTVLHNTAIISGMFLVLISCGYMAGAGRLKPMPFLASSSFFVFAVHEPFLLTLSRKILLSLGNTNPLYVTLAYFLAVGLTVAVSLGIYSLFVKYAPSLTALLTGGRRPVEDKHPSPDFYGR